MYLASNASHQITRSLKCVTVDNILNAAKVSDRETVLKKAALEICEVFKGRDLQSSRLSHTPERNHVPK